VGDRHRDLGAQAPLAQAAAAAARTAAGLKAALLLTGAAGIPRYGASGPVLYSKKSSRGKYPNYNTPAT
ncbi:MAG: hypothetical protein ACTS5Y_07645, partial [Pollutimonas bauzanensis]